jgi:lysyl-tRNA synthetase class 2
VADWRPSARLDTLKRRAELLAAMRRFFHERGVLEIEAPILSGAATPAPYLESFRTRFAGPGGARDVYLHTSPEFPLKRLLAAGSGPVYSLGKVFRQGEAGRLHNPEFTMLEWYRPGLDYHGLMDEVEALVRTLIPRLPRAIRVTYRDLFERHLGLDPHGAGIERLRNAAGEGGPEMGEDRDGWLDLLMSHRIEPCLDPAVPVFVYDYPASQAALARVRAGDPPVAERFELYCGGMELANGFHELQDAAEQRRRFEAERSARRKAGMVEVPLDEPFLTALEQGLPDCAGVALGVDRLVMLATGASSIGEVLAFDWGRA